MQFYGRDYEEALLMHVMFFLAFVVQLLGIPAQVLQQGLTHRKIEARTEEVTLPLKSFEV